MRPPLFHAYESQNILIEGVTFTGSPFWTLTPAYSRNITVRGVTVIGDRKRTLHNDDGFNPDSSQDVLVENCTFDTVCDNIGIKAGRDNDAWGDQPAENIDHPQLPVPARLGRRLRGQRGQRRHPQRVHREQRVPAGPLRPAREVQRLPGRRGAGDLQPQQPHPERTEECIRIESAYGEVSRQDHATPAAGSLVRGPALRDGQRRGDPVRGTGRDAHHQRGVPQRDHRPAPASRCTSRTRATTCSTTCASMACGCRPGMQMAGPIGTRAAR